MGPYQKQIYQVIGVAKDIKYGELSEAPLRTAYVAAGQDPDPWPEVSFVLRSDMGLDALRPAIREAFGSVNRSLSFELKSFETQVESSLSGQKMVALLAAAFGALALVLAMVGLYGITAYSVERRRNEIGIRMALGAAPGRVIWLMLRDVVLLVAAGGALGRASARACGRLVASLLYGVRPNDPAQLAVPALILAAAAAVAAYLPARRAARLDPMVVLRED